MSHHVKNRASISGDEYPCYPLTSVGLISLEQRTAMEQRSHNKFFYCAFRNRQPAGDFAIGTLVNAMQQKRFLASWRQ